MTTEKYHNPVNIIHSDDWAKSRQLQLEKLKIRHPLIITTQGNVTRLGLAAIFPAAMIYSDVEPNPTLASCQDAIEYCLKHNGFDGIVALGGGSAMARHQGQTAIRIQAGELASQFPGKRGITLDTHHDLYQGVDDGIVRDQNSIGVDIFL